MPKIRSITYFTNIHPQSDTHDLTPIGDFLQSATATFEQAGFIVQTRRLATHPFPQWQGYTQPQLPRAVHRFFAACQDHHINYLSIGGVQMQDDITYFEVIPDIIAATSGVFATAEIAHPTRGISLHRLQKTAEVIHALSTITPDGMTNLYFAALANCPPRSPFFPVAYHDGSPTAHFALAIQAADLAVSAFQFATTLHEASQNLVSAIQDVTDRLTPLAQQLAEQHRLIFDGFDFSLAPYPRPEESLGGALESLGASFGGTGLIAAASIIMNALESATFPRVGFSGLMLPILEDSVLASRAAEGALSIQELLLLSAVCGTGLDCIPLPGDIALESLQGILLDTAALALRLNKPLTARLMPFPNKKAGDSLTFDFEFFAPSRVLAPPTPAPQQRPLTAPNDEVFMVKSRPSTW